MTAILILAISLVPAVTRTPLLDLYLSASELAARGSFEECGELFSQIIERMPDNRRAIYNNAVSNLSLGNFQIADSLLSDFPGDELQGDTLLSARSSARLGNAMSNADYAGVQSVVEMLLPEVSTGEAPERIRQNYEVALKWLMQNEPPPPEDQQSESEDQEDPSEDQQDPSEDQQDPSEDQQDPSEDQQDPSEDQQDPSEDQEDPNNQPPPPEQSEMTPEVAQMILDMVDEAQADTTQSSIGGAIGAPIW
jgi:hypothetical protein